ncbi:serine/threonine-protein kinase [Sorangium sp. So ce315]|uniref:serine/threonine-protein kinase n=1 Tax=Sorangium sp. So ce315 TaxID=3133299 RepID=UPI003F6138B2
MSELIEAYKLLPGMLLARKYRLSRKIGQGGMGVVWAATNEATGREVALKVIARPDPSLRKRLLREAQSCGALQHPNIVDVIDVARTESGEPCLIMELLVGESVAALLEARRRLDAPLAARIAHDAAGALAAAHAVQIVHRDLKPANLFLHRPPEASDFVVKVLDFGVAKNLAAARGATSTLDAAVGSPFYMSPEQVRAEPDVDPRSDIWALGVVLFEMLTGVRPFQGEGTQLLSRILEGEIPKVSRYLRHVDERLVRIVDRCLRRERGERFASAEEVARELAPFVPRGAGGVAAEGGAGEPGRGGALPEAGARAQQEVETAVAPGTHHGHGMQAPSPPSPEELATTVPVRRPARPEAGSGGETGVRGVGGAASGAAVAGVPGGAAVAGVPGGAVAAGVAAAPGGHGVAAAPPYPAMGAQGPGGGSGTTVAGQEPSPGTLTDAVHVAASARSRARGGRAVWIATGSVAIVAVGVGLGAMQRRVLEAPAEAGAAAAASVAAGASAAAVLAAEEPAPAKAEASAAAGEAPVARTEPTVVPGPASELAPVPGATDSAAGASTAPEQAQAPRAASTATSATPAAPTQAPAAAPTGEAAPRSNRSETGGAKSGSSRAPQRKSAETERWGF